MNKKINKKASSILMIIFELLIVGLVVFMTVRIAHAYGSSLLTQEVNIAEDVRMMVNTLISVPGDAVVKYPRNISEFRLILRQDSVSVFREGDSPAEHIKRIFYLPKNYTAVGAVEGVDYFCLDKKKRKVLLRHCNENEP